jgi:hypothetical protein
MNVYVISNCSCRSARFLSARTDVHVKRVTLKRLRLQPICNRWCLPANQIVKRRPSSRDSYEMPSHNVSPIARNRIDYQCLPIRLLGGCRRSVVDWDCYEYSVLVILQLATVVATVYYGSFSTRQIKSLEVMLCKSCALCKVQVATSFLSTVRTSVNAR